MGRDAAMQVFEAPPPPSVNSADEAEMDEDTALQEALYRSCNDLKNMSNDAQPIDDQPIGGGFSKAAMAVISEVKLDEKSKDILLRKEILSCKIMVTEEAKKSYQEAGGLLGPFVKLHAKAKRLLFAHIAGA